MVSKAAENKNESGATKVVATPVVNWGSIDNISDARQALMDVGVPVMSSANLFGDGAELIKDKSLLVGSPFLVIDWRFITDEKTKREYVSVLIISPAGQKGRFNDGSTGVYKQLKEVTEQYGGPIGIDCKNGLRASEYDVENEAGGKEAAVTYYLSV